MFESTGTLIYDPKARIKQEPWWLILKTDKGILDYYQSQIKQHFDVGFEKTVWGSHISVVRGDNPPKKEAWGKYKNEKIKFTYTNQVYRAHWFFCIDAYSERLEEIRMELGLPKLPKFGFHLTIGRLNKQYLKEANERRNKITTGTMGRVGP